MTIVWRIISGVGGVAAILLTVWAAVRYVAKKYVDSQFDQRMALHKHSLDRQLENHKNQLTIEAEAIRTDNQRRLRDFGLFSEKKHQVYPELYRLLRDAFNRVQTLTREFGFEPNFDSLSSTEISIYMQKRGVPENDRLAIVALWDSDQRTALDMLAQEVEIRNEVDTRKAIAQARDYLDMNLLYLTGPANARAQMSVDRTARWFAHWREGEGTPYERDAIEALSKLLQVFNADVRAGDYTEIQPTSSPDTSSSVVKPEAKGN